VCGNCPFTAKAGWLVHQGLKWQGTQQRKKWGFHYKLRKISSKDIDHPMTQCALLTPMTSFFLVLSLQAQLKLHSLKTSLM
jgi:hypothetical protein